MPKFRIKSLKAGIGPLGAEVEVSPGDRSILHPLFVVLRDKRALLYAHAGREDSGPVTKSIEAIREELTVALKDLGPDSPAAAPLETLRRACREYLDAAGGPHGRPSSDFSEALGELRGSFRSVAADFGSRYELPTASDLAAEMAQADEEFARDAVENLGESTPQTQIEDQPGLEGVAKVLVAALDDTDSMVRFQAMASLRDHLSPSLIPVLEPLLSDADSDIRRYALEYYAELRPSDTADRLVAALDDTDSMVRFQAMASLRDHLSRSLIPVLEPLLSDADSDIRRYALEYYAELRPSDTADRLVAALDDTDSMVRFQAMASLRDHLSPSLIPVLEPLLSDADSDIRRYALEYYAEVGGSRS